MNNLSVKKQNRVLLITIAVILTAAAVLIALTGGANKREKEGNPPLDSEITSEKDHETSESSSSAEGPITKPQIKPDNSDKSQTDKPKETEKTPESEKTSAEEDAAQVSAPVYPVMPTFSRPVNAPVLKGYSGTTPVFSYTMNDYRIHRGIDFLCVPGTSVCAAADGVVCEVTDDPMMGVCVGISHSGGAVTRYCGLSEESLENISTGAEVKRGQPIGSSGSTALIESAEENHLHFELIVNGKYENPADFMKVEYLSEMTED